MHYYKRNIGDYHKKAGRLTMLQHGAYTLLIDSCYDREQFPTLEEALDWIWASTTDEIEAAKFVLNKFFTKEGDVFIQKRIKEDLEVYHKNAETNKRIALEREAKRREKSTKRTQVVDDPSTKQARHENEPPPNHKPLTINQEPIINIVAGAPCSDEPIPPKQPKEKMQWEEIKNIYHTNLPMMPQIRVLTDKRKRAISSLFKKHGFDLNRWDGYTKYINDNCRWMIEGNESYGPRNIDYIIREDTYIGIVEGTKNDRK